MTELFSNLGQTTINQVGGIGATDATVTVAALNGTNSFNSFPSSGNFRVILGNDASSEIALCTAVDPVNRILTIVRGQEGSAAKAWSNGTNVTLSLTAQAVNQMRADLFSVGPYLSRPLRGLPTGSYFQPVDGHGPWIWDPTSGQWRPQINGILGFQPPLAATFTTVNTSTGTLTDDRGALSWTSVQDSAPTFRGFMIPITQGIPSFVEAAVVIQNGGTQTAGDVVLGVAMRESGTTKALQFNLTLQHNSTMVFVQEQFSNNTTRTSATATETPADLNGPIFIRLRSDFTTIYADFSRDRVIWKNLFNFTLASIFTTAPDQLGISGYGNGVAGSGFITSFTYGPFPTVSDQVFTPNVHYLRGQIFMPPPNPPPISPPVGWTTPILNR